MATNEEIFNSRLLGYIQKNQSTFISYITVVGYRNSSTEEFIALDSNQVASIFPPNGKLLATGFDYSGYEIKPNSFIECKASKKANGCVYDSSEKPVNVVVHRIITVKHRTSLENGFITQDEIASFIGTTDIPSIRTSFYLKYGNYLYGLFKYDFLRKSIIPMSGMTIEAYEINPENCINLNNKDYYIGNEPPLKCVAVVDCMDDNQLADWFKNLLQSDISLERFCSITIEDLRKFTNYFNENEESLNKNRLDRIEGKVHVLNWTYNELKKILSTNSELTKSLKDSLLQVEEDIPYTVKSELEGDKERLQQEIDNLSAEKENIQKAIDEFPSRKEEMAAELSRLEEKYLEQDNMLQKSLLEMEEKRDALKAEVKELELRKRDFISVNPIDFSAVGDSFTNLAEEKGDTFASLMRENIGEKELSNVPKNLLNDIENALISCQACFIPSVSWAYYYAKGIRNAKLYVMHVEHDWLHYRDFLKNGLLDVLESCDKNATVNHILVFDSLNLTQPECGLKPLLDVISGYELVIPTFDKPMPINLKFFATILPFTGENKIGLPLRPDSFSRWGQVAKPEDKLHLASDFLQNLNSAKGFFTPEDVKNKWKNTIQQENNGYFAD